MTQRHPILRLCPQPHSIDSKYSVPKSPPFFLKGESSPPQILRQYLFNPKLQRLCLGLIYPSHSQNLPCCTPAHPECFHNIPHSTISTSSTSATAPFNPHLTLHHFRPACPSDLLASRPYICKLKIILSCSASPVMLHPIFRHLHLTSISRESGDLQVTYLLYFFPRFFIYPNPLTCVLSHRDRSQPHQTSERKDPRASAEFREICSHARTHACTNNFKLLPMLWEKSPRQHSDSGAAIFDG